MRRYRPFAILISWIGGVLASMPAAEPGVLAGSELRASSSAWSDEYTWSAEGPSGSGVVQAARSDAGRYTFAVLRSFAPTQGSYRISGRIRLEPHASQPPGIKPAAGLCIQWFGTQDAGEVWLGGTDVLTGQTDGSWVDLSRIAQLPEAATRVEFIAFLPRGTAGRAGFSDLAIVPGDVAPTVHAGIIHPALDTIRDADGRVRCFAECAGVLGSQAAGLRYRAVVASGSSTAAVATLPLRSPFAVDLGRHAAGSSLKLTVEIVDGGSVLASSRPIDVRVSASARTPPANAVTIDARGRTIVDGKPFFPLGIYQTGEFESCARQDVLHLIGRSAFNTVMPGTQLFNTWFAPYRLGHPEPPRADRSEHEVRAYLDAAEAEKLRILFPVSNIHDWPEAERTQENIHQWWAAIPSWDGAVGMEAMTRRFAALAKDHPALLAWYVNDETPTAMIGKVERMRALLRDLDPWHPTYGVTCFPSDLAAQANAADICSTDPYPIATAQANAMPSVDAWASASARLGKTRWTVVQLHNMGIYEPELRRRDPAAWLGKHRPPTEDEVRASSLLNLIHGSTGLLFYAYNPLLLEVPERGETFATRWAEVQRVVAFIRDLGPYILGSTDPEQPQVRVSAGKVRVRTVAADDGRLAVLIAGIGPGACAATVTMPQAGAWRSATGRITADGDHVLRFSGRDICGDVAFLDPR